ncbi:MAG: tripartite tricarboxylate transporter permease [Rhodospirillales bacterium]|nr:tripartite tricarboxylate transporter permease [Rhodospirillales bacterium]
MDSFFSALSTIADPYLLTVIVAATIGGVLVGALPGLTSTMATALLVPFTVFMDPIPAISMLAALYCAGTFGGSITAILINAPGAPPAAATALDGYPMAQKGEAGRALGMATVASTIGGIFSVIVMAAAAPMLARMAYQFGPPEYFALALFGLSMLASISKGSATRNLIGGAFGVLVATVGLDFTTGVERFTFGIPELTEGINFIPVMIGIFGGAELLSQSATLNVVYDRVTAIAVRLPSRADFMRCWKTIARSCGIGTFIGILPAEGGTIAAMVGYNEARRWSKTPDEFGSGCIEGIAGPEAANNAATGGAMVPTLALGIPGSGTTAVILAALMVKGLRPGPFLFQEQPDLLYGIFAAMLIANLMFLGIGLVGAKLFARITLIPRTFLWPAVFTLAVIGSFALEQSVADIYIMFVFALLGFVFKRYGFAPAPIIMGIILGGLVENTLKQSMLLFDMQWWMFFGRPICLVFFALTIAGLAGPYIMARFRAFKNGKA